MGLLFIIKITWAAFGVCNIVIATHITQEIKCHSFMHIQLWMLWLQESLNGNFVHCILPSERQALRRTEGRILLGSPLGNNVWVVWRTGRRWGAGCLHELACKFSFLSVESTLIIWMNVKQKRRKVDKIEQDKEREKTCPIPGIKIELIFSTSFRFNEACKFCEVKFRLWLLPRILKAHIDIHHYYNVFILFFLFVCQPGELA